MLTENERFRAWRIVRLRGWPPQWNGSAWRIAAHILCVALAEYQKSVHVWEDAYSALERRVGAAPELLAACEQALSALLERVPGSVPGGEQACEALAQAIVTAKGEE